MISFLKFTKQDGDFIFINMYHILYLENTKNGTYISFNSNIPYISGIEVKETIDEIFDKLDKLIKYD